MFDLMDVYHLSTNGMDIPESRQNYQQPNCNVYWPKISFILGSSKYFKLIICTLECVKVQFISAE